MARAKTAPFQIRFETGITSGSQTITTPDLSMYVDPVNRQALLVTEVDYIWTDSSNYMPILFAGNDGSAAVQIHDSNLGGMFSLTDSHQVSSGSIFYETNGVLTNTLDFFPDTMGRALGGRIIVNDSLEVVSLGAGTIPANSICTVVMECEVVKLSEKDYIALALQTVADN